MISSDKSDVGGRHLDEKAGWIFNFLIAGGVRAWVFKCRQPAVVPIEPVVPWLKKQHHSLSNPPIRLNLEFLVVGLPG